MKTILLTTFLLTSLWAQAKPSLDACINDGKKFTKKGVVDKKCIQTIYDNAHAQMSDVVMDAGTEYSATGMKNMLFIKITAPSAAPTIHLISGPMSGLNDILSVAFSPYDNRVAVLNVNENGQKEIRVFDRTLNGNVGPHKLMSMPEIEFAQSIFYHASNKEIWFTRSDGHVSAIHSEADSRQPKDSKKNPVILVDLDIKSMTGQNPAALAFIPGQLLVLAPDGKSITSYREPLENKQAADFILDLKSVALEGANSLKLDKMKQNLIIGNSSGQEVQISIEENFIRP